MRKHAQATLFIILAIVVIVVAVALWNSQQMIVDQPVPSAATLRPEFITEVKEEMNNCVRESAEDVLFSLGGEGSLDHSDSVFTGTNNVEVLYSNKQSRLPSLTDLEKQVERSLEQELITCFARTIEEDYEVSVLDPKVQATFSPEHTTFSVNWPVTVSVGGQSTTISKFSYVSRVAVPPFYEVASLLLERLSGSDPYIDMTDLLDQQFPVYLQPVEQNILIMEIQGLDPVVEDYPYSYRFGVRLS